MVGTDGRLNEGSIKWKRYVLALYALSQNSFRNSSRVSNSMDPDQVGQNVQLSLDPNCLQMSHQQATLAGKGLKKYDGILFNVTSYVEALFQCKIKKTMTRIASGFHE